MDKKLKLRLQTTSLLDEFWTVSAKYVGVFGEILFHGNGPIYSHLSESVSCLRLMILEAIANYYEYPEYCVDKHHSDSDILRTISIVMQHVRVSDGYKEYITQLESVRKRISEYCVSNMERFISLSQKFQGPIETRFTGVDLEDNDMSILYTCVAIAFFEINRRKMELKLLEQEHGS